MTDQDREARLRIEEEERLARIIPLMEREVERERRWKKRERIRTRIWWIVCALAVIGAGTVAVLVMRAISFLVSRR